MADKAWKQFERRVAEFFSCSRMALSGRWAGASKSDTTHPGIFVECKQRESHAVRTLLDATRRLARRERKVAVLCLSDKRKPGFALVVHSDDLAAFLAAYRACPTGTDPIPPPTTEGVPAGTEAGGERGVSGYAQAGDHA